MNGVFKKAAQDKRRQKVELPNVTMTHPNYAGLQGTIKLSLDVVPEEEARQQPVIAGRDGDAFLTKDFKRPPGMFAGLMNMLDPFAAIKRMMCYACVAAVVVGVLGVVVMVGAGE